MSVPEIDDEFDERVAAGLAFLRRRLSGQYQVDEFGFDHEITYRFLLTALRPLAEKWFRIDVHGIENIPAEGGALVVSSQEPHRSPPPQVDRRQQLHQSTPCAIWR